MADDAISPVSPGYANGPVPSEATSPLDALSVFVTESVPEALGSIVEALHDLGASPAEIASEHFEAVNELHIEMIDALSRGDVDTASALNAAAEGELASAVDHLQDPNFLATHHAEHHAMPQDDAAPIVMDPGHAGDQFGHG